MDCSPCSSRPSSPQGTQPLKVVHIFSPRIFRTDAGNFRTLVQCLTGNNRTNDLCDDSWIPEGCVELTPRKRHSINHHQAALHAGAAAGGAAAPASTHPFALRSPAHFNDLDIVSGLISSDAPDADWLPPFLPEHSSNNLWTCQA